MTNAQHRFLKERRGIRQYYQWVEKVQPKDLYSRMGTAHGCRPALHIARIPQMPAAQESILLQQSRAGRSPHKPGF